MLEFFRGFPFTVRQISGKLGHIRPRVLYDHHTIIRTIFIRLRTATVSDHTCGTLPSFYNQQQTSLIMKQESQCLP